MTSDLRELATKLLAGIRFDYCPNCYGGLVAKCQKCGDFGAVKEFTGDVADLERLLRAIAEGK